MLLSMEIELLQSKLSSFADVRGWKKFHSPKNLAMAISAEAGELLQLFQWLTQSESVAILSGSKKNTVREEVADIAIYLLQFCSVAEINLSDAVNEKIALNDQKYPVNLSKGNAMKYKDL